MKCRVSSRHDCYVLLAVAAIACCTIRTAQCAQPADDPNVIDEFDVANDGDGILLPGRTGGARHLFLLDTGFARVSLDRSLRQVLGDMRRTQAVESPVARFTNELYDAPDSMIGRVHLRTPGGEVPLAACEDLSDLRRGLGERVHGVLGLSFLRRHVVRLDFDRGKVAFLRSPGEHPGIRVPITFVQGRAFVRTRIQDMAVAQCMFEIDTGDIGGAGRIHPDVLRDLQKKGLCTRSSSVKVLSIGGLREVGTFRIKTLDIANFHHSELLFSEGSANSPSALGLGYWLRYVVTLDFPNEVMYLKPSRRHLVRDEEHLRGVTRVGAGIHCDRGHIVVFRVGPNGPAARAGVQVSDALVAVDGIDVRGARLFAVQELLNTEQNNISLTVDRGGLLLDLSLDLPAIDGSASRFETPVPPVDVSDVPGRPSDKARAADSSTRSRQLKPLAPSKPVINEKRPGAAR